MKISVDVDCTPEEARRFMGLPDLAPLHEAYLARMKAAVDQGVTPDMVKSMLEGWSPMGEAGMSIWRQMIDNMGGAAK